MAGESMEQFWNAILSEISNNIPSRYYGPFISPLSLENYDSNRLVIKAPSKTIKNHVEKKYQKYIEDAVIKVHGSELKVEFSVDEESKRPLSDFMEEGHKKDSYTFNSEYNFPNFIVGNSNRLAYMAAKDISQTPGSMNPLFIQGSLGVGKTHLLHAIAQMQLKEDPSLCITYVTLSSFLSEFVYSVQNRNLMDNFRAKYLSSDSLLVDDIQHLNSGAEKTQEEFYHIFNHLYDRKKQVILASDRSCRDLPLQDRLKSRLITGVQVEVKQPDEDVRIRILEKKAGDLNLNLSHESIHYIASNIQADVRSLIGALNDIHMYKKAYNLLIISHDIVKEILENRLNKIDTMEFSQERILQAISDEFSIAKKDLLSKSRKAEFIIPRHLCMYLLYHICSMNKTMIGRVFNTKHTTVINAMKKVEERMQTNPKFLRTVKHLSSQFQYQ